MYFLITMEKYQKSVQIVTLRENEASAMNVARLLSVSRSSVQRSYQRFRETGSHPWRPGIGAKKIEQSGRIAFSLLLHCETRRKLLECSKAIFSKPKDQ